MLPALDSSSMRTASRLLGALAGLAAVVAAGYILLPDPLADAFFAAWVLAAVGLGVVGGLAAWTGRTPLVWLAALLLTGLSILGTWSIGPFIAPAVVCLLGAAFLSQLAGPRTDRVAAGLEPAVAPGSAARALAGAGAAAVGGGLAYAGAIDRGLFGACARETLSCALAVARWDAIGLTVLGLLSVGLGVRVCYRQLRRARVRGWVLIG